MTATITSYPTTTYSASALVDAQNKKQAYNVIDDVTAIAATGAWDAMFRVGTPVSSLTITGATPALSITASQYSNAVANAPKVMSNLKQSTSASGTPTTSFTKLSVTGVGLDNLQKVLSDTHVETITVSMKAAEISASLSKLLTSNKIATNGITVFGGGRISLSYSTFLANGGKDDGTISAGSNLAKIGLTSADSFEITGATVEQASKIVLGTAVSGSAAAIASTVSKVSVADTASNISADLAATSSKLKALGTKLVSFKQSDGYTPISITAANYLATSTNALPLDKLAAGGKLSIDASTTGTATTVQEILAKAKTNNNSISKLTINGTDTHNLTAAEYQQLAGVVKIAAGAGGTVPTNYKVNITNSTVAQAASLLAQSGGANISHITVGASSTDLNSASSRTALANLANNFAQKVTFGEPTLPITLSKAQFVSAGGLTTDGTIKKATTTSGVITSAAAMGAGDLYINGVSIGALAATTGADDAAKVSARVDQLVAAINTKTAPATGTATGVTAARVAGTNTYTLTADFGRAIVVTSDKTTTQAAISGFAVEDAKAGVGGKVVNGLSGDNALSLLTLATKVKLTGVLAADAAPLLAGRVSDVTVEDSSSNIADATNLAALGTNATKITSITVKPAANNPKAVFTVTAADFKTDTTTTSTSAIAKLAPGTKVAINTAAAVDVSSLIIKAGSTLSSLTLVSGSTDAINLTYSQYKTYGDQIYRTNGTTSSLANKINITGATSEQAQGLLADARVDNIAVEVTTESMATPAKQASTLSLLANTKISGVNYQAKLTSTAVKSSAAMLADDLYINGVAIVNTTVASTAASYLGGSSGTVSARVDQLVAAINAKTGTGVTTTTTGVTAARVAGTNTYTLTSATGSILVQSKNTSSQADASGFAVEDSTGSPPLTAGKSVKAEQPVINLSYTQFADLGGTNTGISGKKSVTSSTITSAAAMGADDLYINGVSIGALAATTGADDAAKVSARVDQLVNAINAKNPATGTATGVTAARVAGTNTYTLTAATGSILVQSKNLSSQAAASGFAVEDSTGSPPLTGGTAVNVTTTLLQKFSSNTLFSVSDANASNAAVLALATGGNSRVSAVGVKDTGVNIQNVLGTLGTKVTTINQIGAAATPINMTAAGYTDANTANASNLKKLDGNGSFAIDATAYTTPQISTLIGLFETNTNTLSSLKVKAGQALQLTYSQYDKLKTAISSVSTTDPTDTKNYTVNITDATIAQAASLATAPRIGTVKISDSIANAFGSTNATDVTNALSKKTGVTITLNAATGTATTAAQRSTEVSSNLAKMSALGSALTAINTGDATDLTNNPLALSYVDLGNYATTLNKINATTSGGITSGNYKVNLTDAQTYAQAAVILGGSGNAYDSHINTLSINTDRSTIATNIATLTTNAARINKIAISDWTNTSHVELSDTQYANSALKSALTSGMSSGQTMSFNVSGVTAANSATVANDATVSSVNVADTGAGIAANLFKLASAGTKLGTITQSDKATVAPALAMIDSDRRNTYATVLRKIDDAVTINTFNPAYTIAVTNVGVTIAAAALTADHVSGIVIKDTSANIGGNYDAIAGIAPAKLQSIGNSLRSGSITGSAAMADGDLYINGLSIGALAATTGADDAAKVSARVDQLVAAINAKTGTGVTSTTTGVTATRRDANAYQLTSADGSAITVTSNNSSTQLTISGFSVKDASNGVGGTSVTSGAIELTAAQYRSAPSSATTAYSYAGGMTINNKSISAPSDDSFSYVGGVQSATTGITSAKAMAAAINAANVSGSTPTGVAATASTSVTSTEVTAATAMTAGALVINGVDIGAISVPTTTGATAISDRVDQLVTAINAKTSGAVGIGTGVTATRVSGSNTYTLAAADGRNIDVTSTGSAATGLTTSTRYGTLALTSGAAFTIAGTVAGSGLAAYTYTAKTAGSTAATAFNPDLNTKLGNLTITAAASTDAEALKGQTNIAQIKVTDSLANVASNAVNLAANTKVESGAISLTATNSVSTMTAAEYATAKPALNKIAATSPYQIMLKSMSVSDVLAFNFSSNPHVATVSINDSASNITANWDKLKALGDTLSSITITEAATPTATNLSITYSDYSNSTALLSKINGRRLEVTGVSASGAKPLVDADPSVVQLKVSDTGDHIEAKFLDLNSLAGTAATSGAAVAGLATGTTPAQGVYRITVAGKLTEIARSDTAPIDIDATKYANGSRALEVLLAAKTINVTGLDVATAVDITSDLSATETTAGELAWNSVATGTKDVYDQKVLVSVLDTKANIEADLAGTSQLKAIDTLTQLGTIQASSGKVDISGATYLAETYKDLLPNLVDGITVSNVTAANFAAGKPNAVSDVNVSSFTFKDSAANIASVLEKLAPGTDHLTTSKLTEIRESEATTTPIPVTLAQVNTYRDTLAMVKDSTGNTKPNLNVTT